MVTPRERASRPTVSRDAEIRPEIESNRAATDVSSRTETDPIAVKRALRALTAGTAPPRDSDTPSVYSDTSLVDSDARPLAADSSRQSPTTVVDRAHEALADVATAAAFVADDGLVQLRGAVTVADRAGDHETARAGQRVLASIERYRRSAAGDHFHLGHGTVFRSDGQVETE